MSKTGKAGAKAQIEKLDDAVLTSYAEEFGPVLLRHFMRRGAQQSTAEDLAQNVFVRLAQRASGGEIENPHAYLMQTASSVWNDHLRKRDRHSHKDHVEFEEFRHAPEAFTPDRVLEGREALQRIADALNELPENTRNIYALCRIEGLKRKEVAKRYNMSVSGVDKHLIIASAHIGIIFGKPK